MRQTKVAKIWTWSHDPDSTFTYFVIFKIPFSLLAQKKGFKQSSWLFGFKEIQLKFLIRPRLHAPQMSKRQTLSLSKTNPRGGKAKILPTRENGKKIDWSAPTKVDSFVFLFFKGVCPTILSRKVFYKSKSSWDFEVCSWEVWPQRFTCLKIFIRQGKATLINVTSFVFYVTWDWHQR